MTDPAIIRRRLVRLRWSIYTVLLAGYMLAQFHRIAPGVVAGDLMAAFNTTGAALGSLAAMYYYVYTVMQLPAGVLADTLGARVTVTLGNVVGGIGAILFGIADTLAQASVGRFLVGLGVSVVFVGLMRSNTVWFRERQYGLVSGLTLLLGNAGAIFAAGPLAAVLEFASWRTIFMALGVFSLSLAWITWWLVRNRPQDAGLPSLREMEGAAAHPERDRHWWHDLMGVLRDRRIWPGFWFTFGMVGAYLAFVGLWAIPLLRDLHGLARGDAARFTTVSLAGFAVAALLAGALSDRIGRRRPVIVGAALLNLLVWLGFVFLPWSPGALAYILFGLLGVAAAGFVVSYPAAKEIVAPALAGMALSLVNTGLFLGAAVMQPLFGWVLDRTWDGTLAGGVRIYAAGDYANGLWWMLGFAVIGLAGALRVRETFNRNLVTDRAPV